MTNKNQAKRSTCAIIVLSVIVALLIGVLIASICMQGFTNPDPFGLFKEKDPSLNESDVDNVFVLNPQSSQYVKLLATAATSEENTKTKHLTATVLPDTASDKTVDWSIAFANPASEWATGKTVTDYVTITPTSDGALEADAKCLQAFGEQIIITVTSRANTEAKATCTVDYVKEVSYAAMNNYEVALGQISSLKKKNLLNFGFAFSSIGTIEETDYTFSIKFSTGNFFTKMLGLSTKSDDEIPLISKNITTYQKEVKNKLSISSYPNPFYSSSATERIGVMKFFGADLDEMKTEDNILYFQCFCGAATRGAPVSFDNFKTYFLGAMWQELVRQQIALHDINWFIDKLNKATDFAVFDKRNDPNIIYPSITIAFDGQYIHKEVIYKFCFINIGNFESQISSVSVNPNDVIFS